MQNRKISGILKQNLKIKFFNSTPNPLDGNREEGEFGVIPLFEELSIIHKYGIFHRSPQIHLWVLKRKLENINRFNGLPNL